MKKGIIIAVTCLLSASALICGGIFLHQDFDAQNSALPLTNWPDWW